MHSDAATPVKHETAAVSILRSKIRDTGARLAVWGALAPIIKTRNNMATHHETPVAGNTNDGLGNFFSKGVALTESVVRDPSMRS